MEFRTNLELDAGLGRRLMKRRDTIVKFASWELKREKEKKNQNELLGYKTVPKEWPPFPF